MPGNEQNVTLLSHTAVNENGAATSPIPTPRTSTPKQDGKNTNRFEEASDTSSPTLTQNQASQLDEISPTLPPRNPGRLCCIALIGM